MCNSATVCDNIVMCNEAISLALFFKQKKKLKVPGLHKGPPEELTDGLIVDCNQ